MRHRIVTIIAALSFLQTVSAAGGNGLSYTAIINVPGEAPTIQAGIDAALDGDMVLVAPGHFFENIDFYGKSIVVTSARGPLETVIDGNQTGSAVLFAGGEDRGAVISGFTIRQGTGTLDDGHWYGGGVFCKSSSPTITGNIILNNSVEGMFNSGGGLACLDGAAPLISSNIITGNSAGYSGGGIYSLRSSPIIDGNTITGNDVEYLGGGIHVKLGSPEIRNNIIEENVAGIYGGGIHCGNVLPPIVNNIIAGNAASSCGGGVSCYLASPALRNNTITCNTAVDGGGGFFCFISSMPSISNCILFGNEAPLGKEVYLGAPHDPPSRLHMEYCNVEGGLDLVYLEPGATVQWGPGMIDADPLFVTGPLGDYPLSQVVCGDPADSPCVDSGDPSTTPYGMTGCRFDIGIVDMGYHYPNVGLVTGPGPAYENPPLVRVFPMEQDAEHDYQFISYGTPHYGNKVTCGDVDADLLDEIITAAGPGPIYGPHVRGFQANGTPLDGLSFMAYGTSKWGVNVAAGDIDGDGIDEIITGAGPGAVFGPHVRGWNYDGGPGVESIPDVCYFAYGTPQWGVNVSAGDIDGDGIDEIITGAGPGAVYGPHVRGWNYDNDAITALPTVSFLAYGTNKYGVNVTCGDVDGDGIDEIVTGPGPGRMFGAHVRGWNCDGSSITPLTGFSFLAWNEYHFGVNVYAGADLDGNGRAELVVGCGPDPDAGSVVKVYHYNGSQITGEEPWLSLSAYGDLILTHGTSVAAGRF